MAQPKKSLYDILGVPREASESDIHLAYERRRAALEGASPPDPEAQNLLRQAHDVLKDPKRRAAYDASLLTADERSAAAAQAPDLILEPEAKPPAPKVPWIAIAIAAVAGLAVLFFVMRPAQTPSPPPPAAEAPKAEAPKAEPAALREKTAAEVLADAATSGGQLLSYSMSGQAIPIGIAISTEQGTMITTCHGIPGGAKLVVRVGPQSHPADLLVTDEVLDLCKLQVSNFGTPPVKVSPDAPRAGDRIVAVGMNAQGEPAATEGTVKQILETTEGRLIEMSMPVGQYSSGGGVFDTYGRLIGIASFQHRAGLSIALPASNIAQMRSRGATK